MFCSKCGNRVSDGSRFCSTCGNALNSESQQQAQSFSTNNQISSINTMSLVGFIVACVSIVINLYGVVGIVALILSVIGYNQVQTVNDKGKVFATIGIIIGIISTLYGLATVFLIESFFSLLF